jgi:IS605 OrfB family transposase
MGLEQGCIEEKKTEKALKRQQKFDNFSDAKKLEIQEKTENKKLKSIEVAKAKAVSKGKLYESSEEKAAKKLKNKEIKIEKEKHKCAKKGIEYVVPEIKGKAECSRRIRIYYSQDQAKIVKSLIGVSRWVYNKGLDYLKRINPDAGLQELRDKICANENYLVENKWMLETREDLGGRKNSEFDLRDEALRDLMKNMKSSKAKGGKFQLKYKSKKDPCQSLSVLGKKWNKGDKSFYKPIFNPKIKSSETLPKTLNYDSRLLITQTGKYYLCVPEPLVIKRDNQAPQGSMIFIDPGSKNFITCYDPEGKIITWGKRDVGRLARLFHYKNKLSSKLSKITNMNKKKRMKKAVLRMNENIRNLVSDLHKKLSKWLCSNYSNIFIPRLNFHKMSKLKKINKQKIAALSHCAFLDRLKFKTREYPGCNVLEVNESYTSKTCSGCGYQNDKLRNKDVFDCKSCDLKIGRDANAAKNIMLRYFSHRAIVKETIVSAPRTMALGPSP